MEKNLFTILLNFSDHLVGIEQINAISPEEAAEIFIRTAECLQGYDREMLGSHINPLVHIAGPKGLWMLSFGVDYVSAKWFEDNAVLGAYIIQSDKNGSTREPNLQ